MMIPQRKYQQTLRFPMVSKCCQIKFATIHSIKPLNSTKLGVCMAIAPRVLEGFQRASAFCSLAALISASAPRAGDGHCLQNLPGSSQNTEQACDISMYTAVYMYIYVCFSSGTPKRFISTFPTLLLLKVGNDGHEPFWDSPKESTPPMFSLFKNKPIYIYIYICGHGSPPVNIPIPTKIGSKMVGEFNYRPNRDPKQFSQPQPYLSLRKNTQFIDIYIYMYIFLYVLCLSVV